MSEKHKNIFTVSILSLFVIGFLVWGLAKPDEALSASERRPLAAFPTLSWETVQSGKFMSDFEQYTLDQFPLRDPFRRVKALTALYALGQQDNNGLYVQDGFLIKQEYPLDSASIAHAADRFRYVYERYFAQGHGNVYVSVIPDKNYFGENHLSMDYQALVQELRAQMDYARYIDIFPLLELEDYYRTDTHWRQEKIIDVAQKLGQEMGVPIRAEYTVEQLVRPFYGVYYGQSALPVPAEKLCYLRSEMTDGYKVHDYETGQDLPLYDLEAGEDLYELFLFGSKSLLTLENPAATTERELVVFRDSFGSSLVPLLAEGYRRITVVDIRYISPTVLGQFVELKNQDVLFLYSTTVLNNSVTLK